HSPTFYLLSLHDALPIYPGSSCLNILDSETQQARPAQSADLIRLVQVAEMLPQYAAQSTAVVCNDVPQEIGDWYRLLISWGTSRSEEHTSELQSHLNLVC